MCSHVLKRGADQKHSVTGLNVIGKLNSAIPHKITNHHIQFPVIFSAYTICT